MYGNVRVIAFIVKYRHTCMYHIVWQILVGQNIHQICRGLISDKNITDV